MNDFIGVSSSRLPEKRSRRQSSSC